MSGNPRRAQLVGYRDLGVLADHSGPAPLRSSAVAKSAIPDAARIARAALHDTLDAVAATPAAARVVALDGIPGPWFPAGFQIVPQVDGDLGARLAAATEAITGPVLVVGMDTPQLTPELFEHSCRRLEDVDVDAVLGRADDGGYWTIGFRERRAGPGVGAPTSSALHRVITPLSSVRSRSRLRSNSANTCSWVTGTMSEQSPRPAS